VLPILSSALEVLAISKREFPIALRLIVACNSYHTCRKSSSSNICSLLKRGALSEIEQILGEVVRQQFLSILSRPDVAKISPQKFAGNTFLKILLCATKLSFPDCLFYSRGGLVF